MGGKRKNTTGAKQEQKERQKRKVQEFVVLCRKR